MGGLDVNKISIGNSGRFWLGGVLPRECRSCGGQLRHECTAVPSCRADGVSCGPLLLCSDGNGDGGWTGGRAAPTAGCAFVLRQHLFWHAPMVSGDGSYLESTDDFHQYPLWTGENCSARKSVLSPGRIGGGHPAAGAADWTEMGRQTSDLCRSVVRQTAVQWFGSRFWIQHSSVPPP